MNIDEVEFRDFGNDQEGRYVRMALTQKPPFGSRAAELAAQAAYIATHGVTLCAPIPEISRFHIWLTVPPLPVELALNPFHKPSRNLLAKRAGGKRRIAGVSP